MVMMMLMSKSMMNDDDDDDNDDIDGKIHKFKADYKDRVMDLTTWMNMTMIKMIRTPFTKWDLTTRPESPISYWPPLDSG